MTINHTKLANLIRSARSAQGFAPQDRAHPATSKPPAVVGIVRLSEALPAPTPEMSREYDMRTRSAPAGSTNSISHQLLENSRVARAGAVIIPVADAPDTVNNDSGIVAWYKRPTRFSVVTAAPFSVVADGADVPVVEPSVFRAGIDLGEAASHGIRFELSRADQRERSDEEVAFEISRSFALGLAQVADSVLLAAVAAATPSAFTLAKAATKGLMFGELRAIAGTTAAGAAVGADGVLRAAGISAELTDQTAGTYIGAWYRSAVGVDDEIRVVIERRDLQGRLQITAFVNAQALLPDPAAFWTAA
ncbi:hypothetical protein AB7M17_005569 [Bradyrhizobium sp. USDA 377]